MRTLRAFVEALDRRNLLARVGVEVDANQEIPEIHRRVIAAGGPALYFERVRGSRFPVVTNLFGTSARMDLAFGEEPIRFVEQAVKAAEQFFPPNFSKIAQTAVLLPRLFAAGVKRTRFGGRATEVVVENPDLSQLPFTKSWPEDGGAFLTLPLVYTEHPDGRGHNLGIYRMQRYDQRRLGMHWQIAKGGGFHYHVAEDRHQALPVTVHLGGPPALLMSAVAPLPENVGELLLAGLLGGKRIGLQNGQISPIVADCEFALLGTVPPRERHPEGPFGDHYGYYSLQHDYPVFHCQKIFHARDAIFPATVVGKPRQEDYYIGEYLQRLLKPLFPLAMPGVVDLWSYGETGFHALAAATVRERYAREAMVSAFRILGEGQLALTKFLLVTDQRLELQDFKKTLETVLERADFSRDLYIFDHLSMDTLDYCGPEVNKGSKGILLGVGEPKRPLPGGFQGELAKPFREAKAFCRGCLVVAGETFEKSPELAQRAAKEPAFQNWPLVILVDDVKKALSSETAFLWTVFTRFEPAADLYAASQSQNRHHIGYQPPIAIDARMKPNYPKELFCDPQIAAQVSRRWSEYFPQGMVEGSSDLANL